jgi:hypothetical protein
VTRFKFQGPILAAVALLATFVVARPLEAMDAEDSPSASANEVADICSLYAWHDAEADRLRVALTFDCNRSPGMGARYDEDVLYTIHIDNTATLAGAGVGDNENDNLSDLDIEVRFGQDASGEWGVQFANLPGAGMSTFSGPVQTNLDGGNGTQATAGLFDDPFFMDSDGLASTLVALQTPDAPLDLMLTPDESPPDSFEGTNTMAIVIELPLSVALAENPDSLLQVWASTRVLPN